MLLFIPKSEGGEESDEQQSEQIASEEPTEKTEQGFICLA